VGVQKRMSSINRGRPDFLLLFLVVFLVSFGLVMLFSASSPVAVYKFNNAWYYLQRQGMFVGVGLVAMLVCMALPYSFWKRVAAPMLLVSIVLLVLVLIVGANTDGAVRWFSIGPFKMQPSEMTKFAIIVYLAAIISRKGDRIRNFAKGLFPILMVIGVILLLVYKQPDFGTVLVMLSITVIIIVFGGADIRHLLMLAAIAIPAVVVMAFSEKYRIQRILSFLNPVDDMLGSGYQIVQSLYALGHGGLTGTGLGQSVQKLFYLPAAHTDFIFAIVGEEFGFFGSALLVIVFLLYFWRGFLAALRCQDQFGMLLGVGIIGMMAVQFLLNVGAVTGSLPITGITLPFISYGGSSLILCMACTGVLLSISREQTVKKPKTNRFSNQKRG